MKKILKNFSKNIISYICKIKYRKKCKFYFCSKISRKSYFEGNNMIGENVEFYNSYLGKSSYISHNSSLSNVKIGKFCSIAKNVKIIRGAHPINFVSTSPLFYSLKSTFDFKKIYTKNNRFEELKNAEGDYASVIGNDVWIGENVSIMQGIKIGDGVIIGANALVNKDLPPYSIAVGVPAKVIKYRFDSNTIKSLLKIKWWDKDELWLECNSGLFNNIDMFLSHIEREDLRDESKI